MSQFGLILGLMFGAIALVIWYRWHKSMTGGEGLGALPRKVRDGKEDGSLEDFVAAYRRGEVSVKEESDRSSPAPASASAGSVAASATRSEPVLPTLRDPFLSGATKLVYYVCKSGLRDHHVFAHVSLQSLGTGRLDGRLAESRISVLVCNAGMSVVAAIDVVGTEAVPDDAAKVEYLRSLGIRYLRMSPKSLPKPEDIRTLLYRM